MSRKPITEDMHLQDEWYKRAKDMKPEDFLDFANELSKRYEHDYGTVCHAMAAIGLAAMYAFNKTDGARGGITGFQAGCVMWEVIRHMNYENNSVGCKNLKEHKEYLKAHRKFIEGEPITDLTELLQQEWVMWYHQTKHIEVFKSTQLRSVLRWLEIGAFRKAIRKESEEN